MEKIETQNYHSLEIKLENFNGPLDLLLHLVKEAKIEIKDIFLSNVTAQFLSYMSQIETLDLVKASEYMEITATLLEIKSRTLLPVNQLVEDSIEDSPEHALIKKLEEYDEFKRVSQKLKQQENVDRLFKQVSNDNAKVNYVVKDMSLNNLLDAFANILHKVQVENFKNANLKQIKKDRFSVKSKISSIMIRLRECDQFDFSELFWEGDVEEVVVTFIAMLELLKHQIIKAEQTLDFGDITITKNQYIDEFDQYDEEFIDEEAIKKYEEFD